MPRSTALITGAAGFIGSHLAEMLVTEGYEVTAFTRYTSRNDLGNLQFLSAEAQGHVTIVAGDLRDSGAVFEAMRGCRTVFHLGALIAIPYSYAHPREVVETNVLGTLNVLEAARVLAPDRVVHISTSEVYGTAQAVPIVESHPLQGQSPYSASKIGADKIAESYAKSFDVPVVTVRPFNTYGPRQTARAIIPTIISQVLARDEISLGSLAPTRDFTYVTDTARGMMLAGSTPGLEWTEINLGNDAEISVGALARRIMHLIGREVPIREEGRRLRPVASEVERLWAANGLARKQLGWSPAVSLEEGLGRTIDWVKDHQNLFKPDEYRT